MRISGVSQPRFAARTKKKTIPRIVTRPPAQARPRAPRNIDQSISRGGLRGLAGRGGGGGGAAGVWGTDAGTGVGIGAVIVAWADASAIAAIAVRSVSSSVRAARSTAARALFSSYEEAAGAGVGVVGIVRPTKRRFWCAA
jgi:hypothetical protein